MHEEPLTLPSDTLRCMLSELLNIFLVRLQWSSGLQHASVLTLDAFAPDHRL